MNNAIRKRFMRVYVLLFLIKRTIILKKAINNPSVWIKAQNKEIKKFVRYIYSIPFYRKRFDEAHITPDDICTREDFSKLPPLYKEEYREWLLAETSDKSRYRDWMYRQTTGSSGTPLDLYSLPTDRASEIVNLMRCALLQQKGYNPFFDRVFSTMVPKPKVQKKHLLGPRNIKMSSISEPKDLVEGYNRARPDFYYGNKTAVLMIAQYALDNGITLFSPKCVASISEPLYDVDRTIMEQAYGKEKVFDIYGCAETGNFAADSSSNRGKHVIWNDTHAVNLYNPSPVEGKSGVYVGQLMLTSLVHRGFPLVNYMVGDTVELTIDNGVPYITNILGRTNDVIKNLDGTTFKWMHINRIMFGITDILQFRIIQKSYEELVVVLAAKNMTEERKGEIESVITLRAEGIFGADLNKTGKVLRFEWCDRIPPDPTGKIRILVSEV